MGLLSIKIFVTIHMPRKTIKANQMIINVFFQQPSVTIQKGIRRRMLGLCHLVPTPAVELKTLQMMKL